MAPEEAGSSPVGHPIAHHADVAQLAEARRSDRRQCRFESDRQYHLDVAQRERTGFGSRGLEVRALPSRRNARWWNWYHAWL